MSNQKLESTTAGKYGNGKYPPYLEYFQRHYETRRHRAHPMSEERLLHFSVDLKLISMVPEEIKFHPDFVTDDGSRWIAIGFRYVTGNKFILAFPKDEDPKHHDGTISSQHVALFALDDEVSDEELNFVAQAAYAVFHAYSH